MRLIAMAIVVLVLTASAVEAGLFRNRERGRFFHRSAERGKLFSGGGCAACQR